MPELDGRVAVVTGGTRGIGRATCRALSAAGATVVLTGRDEQAAVTCARELAAESGGPVSGVGLDVSDPAAVSSVVRGVAREHGRLDIAVANAGVLADAVIGMITDSMVGTLLRTNVAGTIHTVQAAARAMTRRRTGSIVVLASIVGERGNAGQTTYAASKAAVATVARSAAKELGRHGIRVNAVAPGVIRTDMTAHLPAEVLDRRVADTPLGRLGTPDDVARVIRFLVSDDAAFVTGQVLGVDGGLVL